MTELTPEAQLSLISKAWGRQRGYCFFPWIAGDATSKERRIQSYHEGPAFRWPRDKEKILQHLKTHRDDDVYWCPSLFERDRRQLEFAMDEHCLWADLDEVDPATIQDYPPTIAWETSPGRYQALWLITGGLMGASWQGNENHRLTYYIGADVSGWDTTQLLRIPGWKNYKPEYRQGGDAPQGKLLWHNGRRYLPDDFSDLPTVPTTHQVETVLEGEVERVDRHEVWGRVRLKVSKRVRELVSAREALGDRSSILWEIERELADAGCTVTEIVAIVRGTVWNKFLGRADELKRLTIEASKAVDLKGQQAEVGDNLEAPDVPRPDPIPLFALLRDVRQPTWLIRELWAEGACGFFGGQPKSFKSWMALDMALSVATGLPFLDHFTINRPGPVLYIQEEDPPPMVKHRVDRIWPTKQSDKMSLHDGQVVWMPSTEVPADPPVMAYIGEGFVISDVGWQSWLDEVLAKGYEGEGYRMLVIDPLMMVAGDVEENRSQEMTERVFKPLKQLARKHEVAVVVVHHMRKGDPAKPTRGGQLLLGSVANHAWSEDSLYLRLARGGDVVVERESKHTVSGSFRVGQLRNKSWTPVVTDDRTGDDQDDAQGASGSDGIDDEGDRPRKRKPKERSSKALDALKKLGSGQWSTRQVAEAMGASPSGAYRQLVRLETAGKIHRKGTKWVS